MPTTAFGRYSGRAALAAILTGAILATSACTEDNIAPQPADAPQPELTQALDDLVSSGFPGVQVVISGPNGQRTVTAGAGDLATGAPFDEKAHVRIGSNTKAFVATVLLQLVAEGKVELDGSVERYLPGVVQGGGNDGNRITVRQLLQHTSGLPDYLGRGNGTGVVRQDAQLDPFTEAVRWQRFDPAELVRNALTMPPNFEPGARSVYTNTNYLLLGMLIERVTGRPVADEIGQRIIEPLGLRDTYFPGAGETGIRTPHPIGYQVVDGKRIDYTDQDPSWAGAAGAMIATGADLNTFFTALHGGKLLPQAQLDEMRRTVPLDREPGSGYGLGATRTPLSCGKDLWGHGGSIPGFQTRGGVTDDGIAVNLTVNELPTSEQAADQVAKVVDIAVCSLS